MEGETDTVELASSAVNVGVEELEGVNHNRDRLGLAE
jgi:hypothetical protein